MQRISQIPFKKKSLLIYENGDSDRYLSEWIITETFNDWRF